MEGRLERKQSDNAEWYFSIQHHGRLSFFRLSSFHLIPTHMTPPQDDKQCTHDCEKGKGKAENCFLEFAYVLPPVFNTLALGFHHTRQHGNISPAFLCCCVRSTIHPSTLVFVSSSAKLLRCAKEWIIKGIYTFSHNDTEQRLIALDGMWKSGEEKKTVMRGHKVAVSSWMEPVRVTMYTQNDAIRCIWGGGGG